MKKISVFMMTVLTGMLFLCGCNSTEFVQESEQDCVTLLTREELVKAADVVVSGKVVSRTETTLDDNKMPYAIYDIEILDVYKGELQENIVKLYLVHNMDDIGDGTGIDISTADEELLLEQEYLLVLRTERDHDYFRLVSSSDQSVYSLNSEEEENTVAVQEIISLCSSNE